MSVYRPLLMFFFFFFGANHFYFLTLKLLICDLSISATEKHPTMFYSKVDVRQVTRSSFFAWSFIKPDNLVSHGSNNLHVDFF